MINLLAETEAALAEIHKTPDDVAWVGTASGDRAGSWASFAALARDFDYDAGYGTQYVADSLVVVLTDGTWLERAEYDGSEWWAHKAGPLLQLAFHPLEDLSSGWRCDRDNEDDDA